MLVAPSSSLLLGLGLLGLGGPLACSRGTPEPAAPRTRYTPSTTVRSTVPAPAGPVVVAPGAMRNVVVIVVDTLRDDAVQRADTPTIDGLVARGAQRSWAWAASTWTAPSVASIMTGMSVRAHGWDFPFPVQMEAQGEGYPPLPEVPVMAEVFRAAGFRTDGWYANRLLGQGLGYGRGFDRWEWGQDADLVAHAAEAIHAWAPEERHFVYLHLMGPHHPLSPSERSRTHWGITPEELGLGGQLGLPAVREGGDLARTVYWRAYHAVVEDTDERLGVVMRALRPHLGDTAVVITSDHGEALGEHDQLGHERGVWEVLTRVPVVALHTPPLPRPMAGTELADLVTTAAGVAHTWPTPLSYAGPLVSQREGALALSPDGGLKAIWDPHALSESAAYDLGVDSDEERPLRPVPTELVRARATWLATTPAGTLQAMTGAMDEGMVQALKELGYMQ